MEDANGGAEPPSLEQQLADSQTEVAKIVAQQQQSNGIAAAAQGAAGALARGAAGDSQPDDWDRASWRASAFGMLVPPPHRRVGSFGIFDKQAKYKVLSKTWSRSIAADPTRAGKVFPEDEAAKLANLEVIGRRLLDIKAGIQACVNLVPVDSEAVGLLLELEEEIELAIQSGKGDVDQYTLQWLHPDRFKALAQMQRHYDHDNQSDPACMLPGNIDLDYQVTVIDLKSYKKDLKKETRAEVRGGGHSDRRDDATQARNRRGRAAGAAPNPGPAQPQQRFGRGGGPSASGAGAASG